IPGVKTDGLKKVQNALVGLVLILASYLILRTIDPRFVAVPATLVPSLPCPGQPTLKIDDQNCKAGTSNTMNLLNRIISEAQRYNQSGQLAVDQAKKAKNDLVTFEQNKASLQSKLAAAQQNGDQSQVQQLETQIADADNQISSTTAAVTLDTGISIMDNGGVSQSLSNINRETLSSNPSVAKIDQYVQNGLSFIDQTESDRASQLQQLGAYDQVSVLQERAAEDRIALQLDGVDAKANPRNIGGFTVLGAGYISGVGLTTVSKYQSQLSQQLDTIQEELNTRVMDPVQKKQLQSQLDSTKADIAAFSSRSK
ncbi:hypothetical protein KGP36_07200, partial [Patescibacteria group bacterium]|nr:hypothetical protein [Patescibacteria group bacterium]